jgi:hypothetical protein
MISGNHLFLTIAANPSSALQTQALYIQQNVYPWTEFAGLVVSGIVFIVILKMVFKWDDFSILFRKIPNVIE